MKKALVGSMLALFTVTPLVPQAQAAPPSGDYELLFNEEFSGTAVNETHWRFREGRREGANINSLNLRKNATVSDGALHVSVQREKIDGKMEYTGGGLISKHQFGYGYYECLSRPYMAGTGVHSSFWQSGGAVENNAIFEIDSYEIDSHSNMGCNNLYVHISPKEYKEVPWPSRGNIPFKLLPGGWFLDAYEFTPEGVIFYDNGVIVSKAEWPELTSAQVVWLTALNGCGKVDDDKLPGESTFKYFRFYAKDYPGINLLPNGNFEYNQDKIDPLKPVSWQAKGTQGANRVVKGEASRDQYKLRQGKADAAWETSLRQALEFIRNGDYQLSAMVRTSGGSVDAALEAVDCGSQPVSVKIPASKEWIRVTIPSIPVSNHGATIAVKSKGAAGEWVEVDDIQFMKPAAAGQTLPAPKPVVFVGDPIWSIAEKEPIVFTGDEKFYFFSRNVGYGESITVSFAMEPCLNASSSPIARIPAKGNAGWAVRLTEDGSLVFRIGSAENHRDVVVPNAWEQGKESRVACVFDRGTASIYINGKLLKKETGITQTTTDATKAGKMGAVSDVFEAVGDVTVRANGTDSAPAAKSQNYSGTLRQVRIYNRALAESEIAAGK